MTAERAPRRVPAIHPPGQLQKPVRLIVDTDCANEVDDQYALALALLSPERIELRGVVAAHFGDRAGNRGIDLSFDEIGRVLDQAGMVGRFPVLRGSHALRYSDEPQPS